VQDVHVEAIAAAWPAHSVAPEGVDAGTVLRRWTLRTSDEGLTVETVQALDSEPPALERVMRLVLERSG
jgi:hypothetical protein